VIKLLLYIILSFISFLFLIFLYRILSIKKYKINIYINDILIEDIFYTNIKDLIAPKIILSSCNDEIDITDSIILVSSDPIVAKILNSGRHIKIGTIASDCKIFLKHKNKKYWPLFSLYRGFILKVNPGPPYVIEIVRRFKV